MYVNTSSPWWPTAGDPLKYLEPFLRAQPYVSDVRRWQGERVDYNLDRFREFFETRHPPLFLNLAALQLQTFGLDPNLKDQAWLRADCEPGCAEFDLVVNRVARWQSPFFNWRVFLARHARRPVFVGLPAEHRAFSERFGEIHYVPTPTLLDVARLIASVGRFAGSQSCAYVIAEGMKVEVTLESSPDVPNGLFFREGRQSFSVYP